ncbi:MAG: T9SS type A sorting domain-containing protein, partial [Bacteroidota bacterium]
IGRVEGAGSIQQLQSYQFLDQQPSLQRSYYRLRQVDFDGQFHHSERVEVGPALQAGYMVFPNPTQDRLHLQWAEAKAETLTLEVFSRDGRRLLRQIVAAGTTQTQIDLSQLPQGLYMLRINDETTSESIDIMLW